MYSGSSKSYSSVSQSMSSYASSGGSSGGSSGIPSSVGSSGGSSGGSGSGGSSGHSGSQTASHSGSGSSSSSGYDGQCYSRWIAYYNCNIQAWDIITQLPGLECHGTALAIPPSTDWQYNGTITFNNGITKCSYVKIQAIPGHLCHAPGDGSQGDCAGYNDPNIPTPPTLDGNCQCPQSNSSGSHSGSNSGNGNGSSSSSGGGFEERRAIAYYNPHAKTWGYYYAYAPVHGK